MAASGGKSSTSGSQSSQFAPQLMQLYRMTKPTIEALASQTREGLQTGGINSRIPAVNASLAAARSAYSQGTQGLKDRLSQSGLGGSSFAQALLAENEMAGGQRIAQIPTDITQAFLSGSVPAVTGIGTSALGEAAGLNRSFQSSTNQFGWEADPGKFISELLGGAGQGALAYSLMKPPTGGP